MAKKQVRRSSVKSQGKPLIPEKYHDYIYVALLVISLFIFFAGAISGGGFVVSDNIASLSFKPYLNGAADEGHFPLWLPYIFSGMPSYASLLVTGERVWDLVVTIQLSTAEFIGSIIGSDVARVLFYYILYSIGIYYLLRMKKQNRFVSFFAAFAATFSTGIIVWVMIGHNTKPVVMSMLPWVFMFMERLREKFTILFAALLVVAMHIMFEASHVQMIFYAACAIGLYLLFEFISRLISKQQPMSVLRVGAIILVAGGLSYLMSADRYMSVQEYTPHSTRGSAPLLKTDKDNQQNQTGGNDYDYATMWSFSPQEIVTFIIPNYFGFGKLDYEGQLTGGRQTKLMTYWGQKPFEDVAPYMGIIIFGLAVIGIILYRKIVFVQFLAMLSLFALLLSFGYTFPILYDFFFYNIPNFDKFRAPSMVLVLIQFAFPILAAYGLTGIVKAYKDNREQGKKIMKIAFIASGAFLVIGFLFSAAFKETYYSAIESSGFLQNYSQIGEGGMNVLKDFIWESMISDWYVTAFIAVVAAGLGFIYMRGSLSKPLFFTLLAVMLVFDLWRVGYRPMEVSEEGMADKVFANYDYIDFIKQEKALFRVADFVAQSPNIPAYYFLENINGYHAAKLRVYQDMLDATSGGSTSMVQSPFMWNLLNAVFIIYPQELDVPWLEEVFRSRQTRGIVYLNRGVMERARFVNRYEVADEREILDHLKKGDFDPRDLAYLEEDPGVKIDTINGTEKAIITKYANETIEIDVVASGTNLLHLSEVYYPEGWKAYIDGIETKIYKTNFLLRSIIVPEGPHKVSLKFESPAFEQGRTYSTISNWFVVLALVAGIFLEVRKKRNAGGEKKGIE